MPSSSPDAIRRHREESNRRKVEQRARLAAIKEEAGCVDCGPGIWWPACVLAFDHLPERGVKVASIANMVGWSWDLIEIELAKTVVRCHNHHALCTQARREQGE